MLSGWQSCCKRETNKQKGFFFFFNVLKIFIKILLKASDHSFGGVRSLRIHFFRKARRILSKTVKITFLQNSGSERKSCYNLKKNGQILVKTMSCVALHLDLIPYSGRFENQHPKSHCRYLNGFGVPQTVHTKVIDNHHYLTYWAAC